MLREMRRKDRQISDADTKNVLQKAQFATLSMINEENKPYAIPISFVYEDNTIYLHCASAGYKLENIARNANVCLSAVIDIQLMPQKFSTKFKSAIVFGKITMVNDETEKKRGLSALIKKYSPDFYDEGLKYIERALTKTTVLKIEISAITGKEHE